MKCNVYGSDKYGSYTLTFENGIISSIVKGVIGDSLTSKFIADLKIMAEHVPGSIWGYYSDQSECQGFTPHSESNLVESSKHSIASGCVEDAYLSGSAMAIDQIAKTRMKAGVPTDLQERLFDSEQDAKAFLQKALEKAYRATGESK